MNVKKPIITSLIGLAALAPCKAQKAFNIAAESSVTGELSKELLYSGGVHANFSGLKNNTDVYCGMIIDAEKQFTFESQLENDYSWTKNISSWIRETFHLSKTENNLCSELAPVKFNTSYKKFDTSLAPVYVLQNDFRERETSQCAGVVWNTTYNIDSNNSLEFEAAYTSKPEKNFFKTCFGKLKDNISYQLSYLRIF